VLSTCNTINNSTVIIENINTDTKKEIQQNSSMIDVYNVTIVSNYLTVTFLFVLFSLLPGILLIGVVKKELTLLEKSIYTVFTSYAFWIIGGWWMSFFNIPLSVFLYSTFTLSLFGFFYINRIKGLRLIRLIDSIKKIEIEYWLLLLVLMAYFIPFYFISLPPGCDTTMHGYITRLIIENDAIPSNYRPVLPVDSFGSYSAGYHLLNAYFTGFNEDLLRVSVNLTSVVAYPLTVMGLIVFFKTFCEEKVAIIAAVFCLGIGGSIQNSIGWGGNPTVLAFAYCAFTLGVLLKLVDSRNLRLLYLAPLYLVSIPLIHAIPAVVFLYLLVFGFGVYAILEFENTKWFLYKSPIVVLFSLVLIFPFLYNFHYESSENLTLRIFNWQQEMTQFKYTNHFIKNLWVTFDRLKYRLTDVWVILSGVATIYLLYKKKIKSILLVLLFFMFFYLLFLNCNYWVLPLSEILYPERIAFFSVVCLGVLIAISLQNLFEDKIKIFPKFKITVFYVMILIGVFLSLNGYSRKYIKNLKNNPIKYTIKIEEAFFWIKNNTEEEAIVKGSYNDIGMWIPALLLKPTIGCHMHFIHEETGVTKMMESISKPRYYVVTNRDKELNTPIIFETIGKKIVFKNSEIEIFH